MPVHVKKHFPAEHHEHQDCSAALAACLYVTRQYRVMNRKAKGLVENKHSECPFCKKMFMGRTLAFNNHVDNQCIMNPYSKIKRSCKMCDFETNDANDFLVHTQEEHPKMVARKQTAFKCLFCDFEPDTLENYKEHVSECHPDDLHTLMCSFCDRFFKSQHACITHARMMHSLSDRKLHQCRVCCKRFETRQELDDDMATHSSKF
jgi:hypothetical protein